MLRGNADAGFCIRHAGPYSRSHLHHLRALESFDMVIPADPLGKRTGKEFSRLLRSGRARSPCPGLHRLRLRQDGAGDLLPPLKEDGYSSFASPTPDPLSSALQSGHTQLGVLSVGDFTQALGGIKCTQVLHSFSTFFSPLSLYMQKHNVMIAQEVRV